jgi:hypothetical protein
MASRYYNKIADEDHEAIALADEVQTNFCGVDLKVRPCSMQASLFRGIVAKGITAGQR